MGNGFLTFDMYKFGKIRRHHWKERLEISLKVMRLKRAKVKLRKATKSYRSVCGGGVGGREGASLCRHIAGHKRPWNFATLRRYIFVSFQQKAFKLGNFTKLKALFPAEAMDFL